MLEQCRIVRGDRRRFAIRSFFFKAIAVAAVLSASPVYSAAPATSAVSEIAFTPAPTGAGPLERIDSTYQWSIAMPSPEFERRAYLWVPPQCKRVRAVVVGLQNMLEKLMFQNVDFRQECAAADVAILYIAPGSVPGFVIAQLIGAGVGVGLLALLFPSAGRAADDVIVPHHADESTP